MLHKFTINVLVNVECCYLRTCRGHYFIIYISVCICICECMYVDICVFMNTHISVSAHQQSALIWPCCSKHLDDSSQ